MAINFLAVLDMEYSGRGVILPLILHTVEPRITSLPKASHLLGPA